MIMALVVLSEATPRQALESVLRRSAYVLIPFSLLLVRYYPALGVDYARWSGSQMWIGVTLQKNILGRLCLVSGFFLSGPSIGAGARFSRRAMDTDGGPTYPCWVIALFLLRGSENAYSATSMGTLALGVVVLAVLAWFRKARVPVPLLGLLVLVVVLIGFGVAAPFLGGSNLASVSSAFGRDETLTGRTETWADLVLTVKRQPLLGCRIREFLDDRPARVLRDEPRPQWLPGHPAGVGRGRAGSFRRLAAVLRPQTPLQSPGGLGLEQPGDLFPPHGRRLQRHGVRTQQPGRADDRGRRLSVPGGAL